MGDGVKRIGHLTVAAAVAASAVACGLDLLGPGILPSEAGVEDGATDGAVEENDAGAWDGGELADASDANDANDASDAGDGSDAAAPCQGRGATMLRVVDAGGPAFCIDTIEVRESDYAAFRAADAGL